MKKIILSFALISGLCLAMEGGRSGVEDPSRLSGAEGLESGEGRKQRAENPDPSRTLLGSILINKFVNVLGACEDRLQSITGVAGDRIFPSITRSAQASMDTRQELVEAKALGSYEEPVVGTGLTEPTEGSEAIDQASEAMKKATLKIRAAWRKSILTENIAALRIQAKWSKRRLLRKNQTSHPVGTTTASSSGPQILEQPREVMAREVAKEIIKKLIAKASPTEAASREVIPTEVRVAKADLVEEATTEQALKEKEKEEKRQKAADAAEKRIEEARIARAAAASKIQAAWRTKSLIRDQQPTAPTVPAAIVPVRLSTKQDMILPYQSPVEMKPSKILNLKQYIFIKPKDVEKKKEEKKENKERLFSDVAFVLYNPVDYERKTAIPVNQKNISNDKNAPEKNKNSVKFGA